MTFSIPKRQDDPLGYAKWWLGPELVTIAQRQATTGQIQLHSGLHPALEPKSSLIQLKNLERRAILVRTAMRSGGYVIFHLEKQLEALFLAEAAQPAVPKDSA